MFINREDAGLQLAQQLASYKGTHSVLVAIPRGAVAMGTVMAKELELPLDIMLVKKIGHPQNHEFAIGVASLLGTIVDPKTKVSRQYIDEETYRIRKMLRERQTTYHQFITPIKKSGKNVIIIDDGIATGYTMVATIALIKQENPKKIIVAVPVGPSDTIQKINDMVDEVVCLQIPEPFHAIGMHYQNFEPVTDEDVVMLMQNLRQP